jgi:hypothetical protein
MVTVGYNSLALDSFKSVKEIDIINEKRPEEGNSDD